jgi:hypothetical protein
MWAAVPILISLWPSDVAPTVTARQDGYEQSQPARFAICSFVSLAKVVPTLLHRKAAMLAVCGFSYDDLVGLVRSAHGHTGKPFLNPR